MVVVVPLRMASFLYTMNPLVVPQVEVMEVLLLVAEQ